MKKINIISLVSLAIMLMAGSVLASTDILLAPTTVNVKKNQTFNLTISVDPKGVKNGAITTQLKYPANLLEVTNFSFNNNWLELPGSDQIDNVNGILVKTLGYKQGTSSNVVFGTVSFKAKNSGSGKISVGSGSAAYDANSQNVFSGALQSVNVVIAIATTPVPPFVGAVATPTPSLSVSSSPSPEVSAGPQAQANTRAGGLFATIGGAITLGTGNWLIAIIVILAVTFAVYWLFKRKFKK